MEQHLWNEIVVTAALAKHSYNNELDHTTLASDTRNIEWDMIPVALLKERCWLFLDTQSSRSKLYICFRGTDSLHDALMDCDLRRHSHPYGNVHRGFWIYYEEVREELLNIVTYHMNARSNFGYHELPEVIVTGHSLGASSAAFAAIDMLTFVKDPICVTYGMPPSGDSEFCKAFKHTIKRSYRIVNDTDIAPKIHLPGLRHIDKELILPSYPHNPKTPWDPITHHSMNIYVKNINRILSKGPTASLLRAHPAFARTPRSSATLRHRRSLVRIHSRSALSPLV